MTNITKILDRIYKKKYKRCIEIVLSLYTAYFISLVKKLFT